MVRIREVGFGDPLPLTTDPQIINDGLLRLSGEFADLPSAQNLMFGAILTCSLDHYGLRATPLAEAA